MSDKCMVMLSGGMDSAVALADAVSKFGRHNVIAVTFEYGQRHRKETDAAKALAEHFGIADHIVFMVNLQQIGGSSLTDKDIEVPDVKNDLRPNEVAVTYVPMRNTIFLSICAAYAEVYGCSLIYTGFNWIDSGGYPDTTEEYIEAFDMLLQIGSRDKPLIYAPLVKMTKADIVRHGERLHVPWEKTWSCYKGLMHPCGKCNACVQRAKGFKEAQVIDPLEDKNIES